MMLEYIKSLTLGDILLWLSAFSVVVDISPIKLNPWKYLLSKIGDCLNKNTNEKIENLDHKISSVNSELKSHIEEDQIDNIKSCRLRIIRFSNELSSGHEYNKEYYENIMDDIDTYERYCQDHPKFPNNKASMSILNIKEHYKRLILGEEI